MVSVTTYRDAGFLPHGFVNFVCLLGWSPKVPLEEGLEATIAWFSREIAPRRARPAIEERAVVAG